MLYLSERRKTGNHEGHEEHEVRKRKREKPYSFVYFVSFVVKLIFFKILRDI